MTMQTIPLDGDWQLTYLPEAASKVRHPDDLIQAGLMRVPARVPGNVELDLMRAGELPDPFVGRNSRSLRALELCEWWYAREFDVPHYAPGTPWEIVFEGLDTFATVWVNGMEVGRSDNMFIPHRFDVTDALRPGPNQIAVRLGSALAQARRHHYDVGQVSWERRDECQFVRKPAHTWGWDIMPRAVSAGIWRSVRLRQRPATAIEQVYYWTQALRGDEAVLGVKYHFRTDAPVLQRLAMRFRGECEGHVFECDWPVEFITGHLPIRVPGARLWWPKGYGRPHLYTVTAQLRLGDQVLDERTERIGIRTIDVDRTERAGGAPPVPVGRHRRRLDAEPSPDGHFVFRVNGEPVLVKGSNWVPLDPFHSRDASRLGQAFELLDDVGCNMVRCWGGNVYEDHAFFDLCDERGVMVWQDFAFACNRYPQTAEFLDAVRLEAEAVAAKLRNHPSLAIWCGGNEVDLAYSRDGLRPDQNRITREVLPQVLHRCDPYRHYVPCSPYVSPQAGLRGESYGRQTEQHLWGRRDFFRGPFYSQHTAHFVGETGYHGCPNVSSIKRFITPQKLWPWSESDEWHHHSTYHWYELPISRPRNDLMAHEVEEMFGHVPDDLDTFALASQIAQAEAKKYFIELTRRRKWHTGGILWWNLLDGWPQFSDAVVDYYLGKKLAYHYIRRVQQPVCLMLAEQGAQEGLPLIVGNDSSEDAHVRYRVQDAESAATVAEGDFTVPANQNWLLERVPVDPSQQRLYLIAWESNGTLLGNHYLAGDPPFDLAQYVRRLPAIAALERPFDPRTVAR
ncbi:MAG: glycoside hydrolase family 2 [Candidatus Brocadiaceae bacterium]|nr:glycoside hydrolase family 2 [Candidatus Brocadiaceae bacterium]